MDNPFEWKYNPTVKNMENHASLKFFSALETKKIRNFHSSFPDYNITPLKRLTGLAKCLGVTDIFVKDESFRFGLNAFKALGASYAISKYLSNRLNTDLGNLSFEKLETQETKNILGELTFATTTDGNHGRGVAWAARQLGHKAVIYMPKGSSITRINNIRATGATVHVTDLNYDDTVRLSAKAAEESGWVLVQDTAWEGYEDIPIWIMQGYSTMVLEALEQLNELEVKKPTHVFIQAGVGSLPAAVQGFFTARFGNGSPVTVVVEPDKADCFLRSALAGDGKPRAVKGDLNTIMAGLACGEPNPIAWDILRNYSDMFISCPDYVAATGMRILGNPLGRDERIISGESGAVTTGLLTAIMQYPSLVEIKKKLNLNDTSRILLFNTEGDTDPESYRKVVWDGAYPNITARSII